MMFECLADINSEPIIPPTSNLPITNLLLPISIIGCLADINNEPIISPTSNANNKIKKSRRNKWKNNIARTSYKSLQEEDREMMMFRTSYKSLQATPTGNINEDNILNKRFSCEFGGIPACKASCASKGYFGKVKCCPCKGGRVICRCAGNCVPPNLC
ncbi:7371_t:CDS:2 [Entrophospora sp. SA101]|nr:7371_t:CDS:2 [Entrophospora sp. SA101]